MALDVYLTSLNQDDYSVVCDTIDVRYSDHMPILSWDFHSMYFNSQLHKAKRQQDILKIVHLAKKFHWQNDIQSIFKGNLFILPIIFILIPFRITLSNSCLK